MSAAVHDYLQISLNSLVLGMMVGYIIAALQGKIDFSTMRNLGIITVPIPFKYGFAIAWSYVVPMALLYLITTVETIGDLTATSMISAQPVEGELYVKRISGSILGDGINSTIAGLFVIFGLFPIVGGIFSIIPHPVIGGAMIVMAGTIAASGIRIIATSTINRRDVLIIAISLGLGMELCLYLRC